MSEMIFYSEYFYDKVSKDTEALEKNVHDYPFSSLANFLLLYHYKKINHPDFEKHAKKAALLFNNPNWLQFQLSPASHNGSRIIPENNNEVKTEKSGQDETVAADVSQTPVEGSAVNDNTSWQDIPKQNESEAVAHVSLPGPAKENIPDEPVPLGTFHQNNLIIEERPKDDDPISFEPLHTVDYFASQGIKLNEETLKDDKLANQVKSFTSWLKSMKRLHPSKLEEQSVAGEKQIQTAAEESNVNTEVLTEAMAEVLIKQDKKEKAIEMFNKLSLINPSKSAYFASRIENIKSTL